MQNSILPSASMLTTGLQAAQSHISTDTGSNMSSIEEVANAAFDEYIK